MVVLKQCHGDEASSKAASWYPYCLQPLEDTIRRDQFIWAVHVLAPTSQYF